MLCNVVAQWMLFNCAWEAMPRLRNEPGHLLFRAPVLSARRSSGVVVRQCGRLNQSRRTAILTERGRRRQPKVCGRNTWVRLKPGHKQRTLFWSPSCPNLAPNCRNRLTRPPCPNPNPTPSASAEAAVLASTTATPRPASRNVAPRWRAELPEEKARLV